MSATADIAILITAKDMASPEVEAAGQRITATGRTISKSMLGVGAVMMGTMSIVRQLNPELAEQYKWLQLLATSLMVVGGAIRFVTSAQGQAVIAWMAHKASVAGDTAALVANRIAGIANITTLRAQAVAALITAKAFITSAAAKIWDSVAWIPFAGIGLAIAGVAAMAASVLAIRGKLPSFKYGGIVPGPAGQPVPIMAHGGERFLGVGNNGGGGGGSLTVNIGSWLGDREGVEKLVDKLEGSLRRRQRLATGSAKY